MFRFIVIVALCLPAAPRAQAPTTQPAPLVRIDGLGVGSSADVFRKTFGGDHRLTEIAGEAKGDRSLCATSVEGGATTEICANVREQRIVRLDVSYRGDRAFVDAAVRYWTERLASRFEARGPANWQAWYGDGVDGPVATMNVWAGELLILFYQ